MTLTLVLVCMAFLVLAMPLYVLIAVFSFVDNMVCEALPVNVTSGSPFVVRTSGCALSVHVYLVQMLPTAQFPLLN